MTGIKLALILFCTSLLYKESNSYSEINISFMSKHRLSRSTSECGCGSSLYGTEGCSTLNRIVGGTAIRVNELPWQALLNICNPGFVCYICGGSLINRRYILTAAHCVYLPNSATQIATSSITVRLGDHNITSEADNAYIQTFGVESIHVFNYNNVTVSNDIALLRLNGEVFFSNGVRPICLPSSSSLLYTGRKAWAAGYGHMAENIKVISRVPQRVTLTVLENANQYCMNGAQSKGAVPDTSKLCAYELFKDACQGDSGGPLITLDENRCTLIGIVSYGVGCARAYHAGVYTRVSNYLPWIKATASSGGCLGNIPLPPCDLRCTSVGTVTGKFKLNGYVCTCNGGFCSADDPSVNICEIFGSPCASSGLLCSSANQCNCRQVLTGIYGNPNQPPIVQLSLAGIAVSCSSITGYCCDSLYPNLNLCNRLNTALGGIYFT